MKEKEKSTKQILLEHSEAKVALLGRYLSIYLQILHHSPIKTIYIMDLFAGEGKYSDGNEGSALIIIRKLMNYCRQYTKDSKEIKLLLNDSGTSDIEPDKKKIERIRSFIADIIFPENLNVKTRDDEYQDLIPKIFNIVTSLRLSQRALLFIDPWGYKDIKPIELKRLLHNGRTEILLFLPVSFMYRFAQKSLHEEFPGGKALEEFLTELFSDKMPDISSPENFILSLKNQFRDYFQVPYVDTFSLQRDKSNIYCLFFFTSNKKGFQKMIEAKWNIDKEGGKGHKISDNLSLFTEVEAINYLEVIEEKINNSAEGLTNRHLTDYGYTLGFLPKHTKEVLDKLKQENKIEVASLDGKDVKSFYIGNEERKVLIKGKT